MSGRLTWPDLTAYAVGASTPAGSYVTDRTVGARKRPTGLAAATVLALYIVLLAAGWIGHIPAGHDGLMNATMSPDGPTALVILDVAPGSPFDRAGLKPGDRVLSLDGMTVTDDEGIHQALHGRRAGQVERVRVQRRLPGTDDSFGPVEDLAIRLDSSLTVSSVVVDMVVISIVGLLIVAVGAVVVVARPTELGARLLFLFSSSFAFVAIANTIHWTLPSATLGNAADYISLIVTVLGCTALLHLFMVFPAPNPLLERLELAGPDLTRRSVVALSLLYTIPQVIPVGIAVGLIQDWSLPLLVVVCSLAAALGALIHSYLEAPTPEVRSQLKWILWGLTIFVVAQLVGTVIPAAALLRVQVLPPAPFTAAFAFFPLSIGFAVLRYRLWDIDVIINRTLVYGALTGLVAVMFFTIVVLLQRLFNGLTGSGSDLATIASTLAIAAIIQPLRRHLQAFIDRRFYRRKYDATQALTAFITTVRDEVDLSKVAERLVTVVEDTVQPAHVSLWLHPVATESNGPRQPNGPRIARGIN